MSFSGRHIIYFDDETPMYKFARTLCRNIDTDNFTIEENEDGVLFINQSILGRHLILTCRIWDVKAKDIVRSNIYFIETEPYFDFIKTYGLEDDYEQLTYNELMEYKF